MAHNSLNSPVNSLKGKIWLATTVLGVFTIVFGLIAYFIYSFLARDVFSAVFAPFLLLAALVMIFGWRLAQEIAAPVERVSLLAKSFERGLTATLPKTTGAAETDELLQTVHRLSGQTKKIVEAMSAAADGSADAALAVDLGSDKTSRAFEKLLGRVAESIRAKQDLERLRAAVNKLADEVAAARDGDLSVVASADEATAEIAETINFLIARLGETAAQIRLQAAQAREFAAGTGKTLEELARNDENKASELKRAAVALKQAPQTARKIAADLADSAERAERAGDKARRGKSAAQENLESVGALRRRTQEIARRVERQRERAAELASVAGTIEDLARRAKMVALNASIQSAEAGETGGVLTVVSGEIERLAARADEAGKTIVSLNKSAQAEIGELETALEAARGEATNLSKLAIETSDALGEAEKYIEQFLSLQTELAKYAGGQTEETERSFRVFTDAVSETADNPVLFKKAAQNMRAAANLIDDLRETTAGFKIPAPAAAEQTTTGDSEADFAEFQLTFDPPVSA